MHAGKAKPALDLLYIMQWREKGGALHMTDPSDPNNPDSPPQNAHPIIFEAIVLIHAAAVMRKIHDWWFRLWVLPERSENMVSINQAELT